MAATDRDESDAAPREGGSRFRRTLVRVMTVQVISLLLLWWLQATYAR